MQLTAAAVTPPAEHAARRPAGAAGAAAADAGVRHTRMGLDKYVHCTYHVNMSGIAFEWDEKKNQENIRKHRISFEEAETVFSDEHALLIDDPEHSRVEDRFILLGLSADLHTLVVCHCYRRGSVIRIISARKATRREREEYNRRWYQ
jgi:uncharacterized DUF497 family protein